MSVTPPPSPTRPDRSAEERRAGPPDPTRAKAGRLLLWQSAALLAMLLAFSLALPWKLLAIALGLTALVLGVFVWTATRRVPRAGMPRASAAFGMTLALVGMTVASLPLAAWDETVRLERCTASAVTLRAQQECTAEFIRQVEERTGVPQLEG